MKYKHNNVIDFDPLIDAYEREDLKREKAARIERDGRRLNQVSTNKKRGKATRGKTT